VKIDSKRCSSSGIIVVLGLIDDRIPAARHASAAVAVGVADDAVTRVGAEDKAPTAVGQTRSATRIVGLVASGYGLRRQRLKLLRLAEQSVRCAGERASEPRLA